MSIFNARTLPYRWFIGLPLGMALVTIGAYLALGVWIDPFNLYHSVTANRYLSPEVRIAKRALARAGLNDSYFAGCSMSEEFSVPDFNRDFHADFGNLTLGSATSFEQLNILKQLPPKRYKVLVMEVYFNSYGSNLTETKAAGYPRVLYDDNPFNDILLYLQLNPWMVQELYRAYFWNRYGIDKDPYGHRVDLHGFFGWEALKTWDAESVRRKIHSAWEMQDRPVSLSTSNFKAILSLVGPRFEHLLMYFPPVHGESLEARGLTTPGPHRDAYLSWKRDIIRIAARYPNVVLLDYQMDNAYTRKDENYWDYNHFRVNLRRMIEEDFASYLTAGRLAHPDFGHIADAAYGDTLAASPS